MLKEQIRVKKIEIIEAQKQLAEKNYQLRQLQLDEQREKLLSLTTPETPMDGE